MCRLFLKNFQFKTVIYLFIFTVFLTYSLYLAFSSQKSSYKSAKSNLSKFAGLAFAQSSDEFLINIGSKQSITVLNHDDVATRTPTPTSVLPINTTTPSPVPSITPPSCLYFFRGECRSGCYDDEFRLDSLSAFCEQSDRVCCICPTLTPPACNNGIAVMLTPIPGRGCPYYTCVTPTPTFTSVPTPTIIEEVVVNIGSKQSLTISIVEPAVSPTPTDILPTPTETLTPDTPTPTQELPSNTPIPTSSNTPTPTAETPTVTPTPDLTVTATPAVVTETPTPTLTRTPAPLSPSPTPDYSNEYVVNVGNKKSLTINIGQGALTPSPTGPPVSCITDNDCLDSQKCDSVSKTCVEISCPADPVCNTYIKINHQCILFNQIDGTTCVDLSNNSGFCYSGVCSNVTPTLSPTITSTPTISPTPIATPTEIPVPPNTPRIRFSVKLFGVSTTPDIKVRLKITDLVAWLTPAPQPIGDSCKTPGEAERFYSNIIMTADTSGIYRPKANTTFDTAQGLASVSGDGWIPLVGISPAGNYSLSVKGPLHRNRAMETNTALFSGQSTSQDFDWTAKLLEPGDLPNPNTGLTQDCTVNSIDLSLIESRIGNTDPASNSIADVNYDAIVNGNDIAKVVYTISFKPDDDTVSVAPQAPSLNLPTTPTPVPLLSATPIPTITSQPTTLGWYDPLGNVCNSTNYAAFYSQPGCTGAVAYRTELITPQSPCSTDGSGECFRVGGNPVSTSTMLVSQKWHHDNVCLGLTPGTEALIYSDLYTCAWRSRSSSFPIPTAYMLITPTGVLIPGADLSVTDITRDATSYIITICNQGPGSIVPNLYMLITNVTTGQNYEWQTGYFEYKNASNLCYSEPISCGRIGDSNCSGNIVVRAEADWRKYIVESNETNNIFEKSF